MNSSIESMGLEELERLLHHVLAGIVIRKDYQGFPVTYVNNGFTELTGYSLLEVEQLFEHNYLFLAAEENPKELDLQIKQQLQTGNSYSIHYKIKRKDGRLIWILDKGIEIITKDNHKLLQSILIDITQQKDTEEILRISEARYEIAIKSAGVNIFDYIVPTGQMIHYFSDMEEFNVPKVMDNAVENFIESGIVTKNSAADFRELYRKIERGESKAHTIVQVINAEGDAKTVEIQLTNIFDEKGRPVRAVGVKKDITDQFRLLQEREYGNVVIGEKTLIFEANITQDTIISRHSDWAKKLKLEQIQSFSQLSNTISELIMEEDKSLFLAKATSEGLIKTLENGENMTTIEFRILTKVSEPYWLEETFHIIQDEGSKDIFVRFYWQDIQDQKQNEIRIMEEKQHYEAMLSKSVLVYEVNITKNLFISGHENWESLLGIIGTTNYEEMLHELFDKALHPKDRTSFMELYSRENLMEEFSNGRVEFHYEYRRPNKSGDFVWVSCNMHLFEDSLSGDLRGYSYVEEIDEKKKKELQLIYQSQHDSLTDFYNKAAVEEKINSFFATGEGKLGQHAFFIIDLDYFKTINDTFGHAFGDAVLAEMSSKIKSLFREDDILGRIGGDEFVILMKFIQNESIAYSKAEEICSGVKDTYAKNGIDYKVTVSLGLAFYKTHGKTYQDLYNYSDVALYHSKERGRECFSIYNQEMHAIKTNPKESKNRQYREDNSFNENLLEFVFRALYESNDKETTLRLMMKKIGEHYNVSRMYIFEDSKDSKYTSNTFEWCNTNIATCKHKLQEIEYALLDHHYDKFDRDGILYLVDMSVLTKKTIQLLQMQKTNTSIQFTMVKNGKNVGFIGLDEFDFLKVPSRKAILECKSLANLLSIFLLTYRQFN